jgi:hypothetical protein
MFSSLHHTVRRGLQKHAAFKLLAAHGHVVQVEGGGLGGHHAAELGEYAPEHVHGEINVPCTW